VLIGATPEGRKELVGFTDGAPEIARDWRELLLDLKRRGRSKACAANVHDVHHPGDCSGPSSS
jgi:transposase-like protein